MCVLDAGKNTYREHEPADHGVSKSGETWQARHVVTLHGPPSKALHALCMQQKFSDSKYFIALIIRYRKYLSTDTNTKLFPKYGT